MPITEARDLFGLHRVFQSDPPIVEVRDAIYSPHSPGYHWGLYHPDGSIVRESAFFQGGPDPSGQLLHTSLGNRSSELLRASNDVRYVYGGVIHDHFGHFLVSTMCRYWNLDLYRDPAVRILYHSDIDISEQFRRPYLAQLFTAIGLPPERWQRFTEGAVIPSVLVPGPSFIETFAAHRSFATSMSEIGDRLLAGTDLKADDRPVYFSKEKMTGGTGRIDNENEMTAVLREEGVEILYPEDMSIAQQITIFKTRNKIFGHVGSALHVSVFGSPSRIVGLNTVSRMFSSYKMIDEIVGSKSNYLFPENDIVELPRGGPFHNLARLTDPKRTAREFLEAAYSSMPQLSM